MPRRDLRMLGDGDYHIRKIIVLYLDGKLKGKGRTFLVESSLYNRELGVLRLQGTEFSDLQPEYPKPCGTCGSHEHVTDHHSRLVPDRRWCLCGHIAGEHVSYGKCSSEYCRCRRFSRNLQGEEAPYQDYLAAPDPSLVKKGGRRG